VGFEPSRTSVRALPRHLHPWLQQAIHTGLGTRALLSLLTVIAAAFAYHGLLGLDPSERVRELEGTEEILFEPSSSSPLLIFSVTAWLLFRRRDRLRSLFEAPGRPVSGALLLGPAVGLCLWAHYVSEPSLLVPSLSLAVLGSALWLGGSAGLRAVRLPAVFLLLAMPIPTPVINRIIYPMQLATADITSAIIAAMGLEAISVADRIYTESAVFEVIETCSGVRTIVTLLMAAFLYQELFSNNRLRSIVLIASAPLLGLLTNEIRVIGIVLNPYSDFAAVHTAQGLVMIVLGVLLLYALDRVLATFLPDPPADQPPASHRVVRSGYAKATLRTPPRLAALCVLFTGLAVAAFTLDPWVPPDPSGRQLSFLPPRLDGWSSSNLPLDRQFLGSARFSEWVHRRYQRGVDEVELLAGSQRRYDRDADIFSPKTAIPGSGWETVSLREVELPGGKPAEERLVRDVRGRRRLVWHWRIGAGSDAEELLRGILLLDRSPWGRPGRTFFVRLSTPVEVEESLALAQQRLLQVASMIQPELERLRSTHSVTATR